MFTASGPGRPRVRVGNSPTFWELSGPFSTRRGVRNGGRPSARRGQRDPDGLRRRRSAGHQVGGKRPAPYGQRGMNSGRERLDIPQLRPDDSDHDEPAAGVNPFELPLPHRDLGLACVVNCPPGGSRVWCPGVARNTYQQSRANSLSHGGATVASAQSAIWPITDHPAYLLLLPSSGCAFARTGHGSSPAVLSGAATSRGSRKKCSTTDLMCSSRARPVPRIRSEWSGRGVSR